MESRIGPYVIHVTFGGLPFRVPLPIQAVCDGHHIGPTDIRKSFMYRVGWLGWKMLAKAGAPLLIKLEIARDAHANVFICTSPDLAGLVVESPTIEALHKDVNDCIEMLLQDLLKEPPKKKPNTVWPGEFSTA